MFAHFETSQTKSSKGIYLDIWVWGELWDISIFCLLVDDGSSFEPNFDSFRWVSVFMGTRSIWRNKKLETFIQILIQMMSILKKEVLAEN